MNLFVLQHWMLPDLGWNADACGNQVRTLREEILSHQSQIFQDGMHAYIPTIPAIASPTNSCIELDEVEKNSSRYFTTILSFFKENESVDAFMQALHPIGDMLQISIVVSKNTDEID
jgi:hypothetical protein